MTENRVYVSNANGDWLELPEGFTLDLFVLVSPKSVDELTDGDDFAEIIAKNGQAVSIDLKGLVA